MFIHFIAVIIISLGLQIGNLEEKRVLFTWQEVPADIQLRINNKQFNRKETLKNGFLYSYDPFQVIETPGQKYIALNNVKLPEIVQELKYPLAPLAYNAWVKVSNNGEVNYFFYNGTAFAYKNSKISHIKIDKKPNIFFKKMLIFSDTDKDECLSDEEIGRMFDNVDNFIKQLAIKKFPQGGEGLLIGDLPNNNTINSSMDYIDHKKILELYSHFCLKPTQ